MGMSLDMLILIGGILLIIILGCAICVHYFYAKNKKKDRELTSVRQELAVMKNKRGVSENIVLF